jgi:hypothetical protein
VRKPNCSDVLLTAQEVASLLRISIPGLKVFVSVFSMPVVDKSSPDVNSWVFRKRDVQAWQSTPQGSPFNGNPCLIRY